MIPNAFDYVRPTTLQGAIAALAQHGEAARPMAGGHSLMPMMKLRLAGPDVLIDINELSELHGIVIGADEVPMRRSSTIRRWQRRCL